MFVVTFKWKRGQIRSIGISRTDARRAVVQKLHAWCTVKSANTSALWLSRYTVQCISQYAIYHKQRNKTITEPESAGMDAQSCFLWSITAWSSIVQLANTDRLLDLQQQLCCEIVLETVMRWPLHNFFNSAIGFWQLFGEWDEEKKEKKSLVWYLQYYLMPLQIIYCISKAQIKISICW